MKTLQCSIPLIVLIAFSGCASPTRVVVNQAVGPARPHARRRKTDGELVVYSALEANTMDADHPAHSAYRILDDTGKIVRKVDNRTGSFYQDPVTVSLPPGRYEVEGEAANSGDVLVPVIIQQDETTVLDLDGSTLPQHPPTGEGEWVRLPGGAVIGAKAN